MESLRKRNDWLKWAVSVLPLFFPLYLIRFQIFGIPFTLVEVLIYFCFLIFLVKNFSRFFKGFKLIFKNEFWKNQFSLRRIGGNIYFPVFLLLLAAAISILIVPQETVLIDNTITQSARTAFGIGKGWILMGILYFILLKEVLKGEEKWSKRSLVFLIVSALPLSIWAVEQVITGNFITPDFRASGPFQSANYLALYLGPILVLAGANLEKNFKQKFFSPAFHFSWGSFVLIAVALFFTRSYAAWIAVVLGLIFYFWGQRGIEAAKKLTFRKLEMILLGVLVLAGLFLTQIHSEKFQGFFEFQERSSSAVRKEVWQVAGNLIKENPILGIGLGQFEAQYALNAPRILGHAPYEWVMLHPHNIFLALWLNLGLLGFLAFLGILILAFSQKAQKPQRLMTMALAMLLTVIIHGFFDTPFFKNDLILLFFLILGQIFSLGTIRRRKRKGEG